MTPNQKKTCDALWKAKVIELAGGRCTFPECKEQGIDAHHIRKCRYLNTRWDVENGRCLCREDHSWVETHPQAYEDLIVEEIGQQAYEALREKSLMYVNQFYDEIKEGLKC